MLTVSGLCKSHGALPVLAGLDLAVADGEILALMGPSGSGKTTLLNLIAGFDAPDAGRIDGGGARVGYLFQEDRLLPWLTVEQNIRIVGDPADDAEIPELIDLVGLSGFRDYHPDALSGGMRQRCALARAYHYRCGLLLMDEPFKSLDFGLRRDMLAAFMNIWRRRRSSVLFVTHEVDEAFAVASRLVVLGGRPTHAVAEFSLGAVEAPRAHFERDFADIRETIEKQLTINNEQ